MLADDVRAEVDVQRARPVHDSVDGGHDSRGLHGAHLFARRRTFGTGSGSGSVGCKCIPEEVVMKRAYGWLIGGAALVGGVAIADEPRGHEQQEERLPAIDRNTRSEE